MYLIKSEIIQSLLKYFCGGGMLFLKFEMKIYIHQSEYVMTDLSMCFTKQKKIKTLKRNTMTLTLTDDPVNHSLT